MTFYEIVPNLVSVSECTVRSKPFDLHHNMSSQNFFTFIFTVLLMFMEAILTAPAYELSPGSYLFQLFIAAFGMIWLTSTGMVIYLMLP